MKMTRTQVWGDIHCQFKTYHYLDAKEGSIQLGDMCLIGYKDIKFKKYGPRFFVEGNHEKFPELNPNAVEPYAVNNQGTLFHVPRGYVFGRTLFLGGADSIDKAYRVTGWDWFPDESFTQLQFQKVMSLNNVIEVVVSHECPQFVRKDFFGITEMSPTTFAFDAIFHHFRPKLWIFGHHHKRGEDTLQDCRFSVLPSGGTAEFDLPLGPHYPNFGKYYDDLDEY